MSPQSSIAHYRITSKLGEGGMGAVYRATDTKLGRDVAIKVIPEAFAQDPDRLARFTREAQVLASLNHPNIAAIYGVEERALIMELVPGPTLAERIAQGPIPLPEALPIARQIAEALEYAHEKGVIHRDLKPANIKVTPEGQVKVLDFGLAKALAAEPISADPAASPTLTMRATLAGVILGTAAYMSPEQARGAPTDKRADIWSFGVVLYEMLTGRRTFSGDTVSDILAAVLKTEPDWSALPPETPPAIRRLLRRCLERDRKRRLPDIAVARLEIDEALAAPVEPVPAAQLPARATSRWPAALAILFAIVALALAAVHFREQPPEAATVRFQITAPEKTSFGALGGRFGLALSPDGRHLAFKAAGENVVQIWVRALDSLDARPLPGTEGSTGVIFWSPDSRSIGFSTLGKLKSVDISGGPAQTISNTTPGFVPEGTWNREGVILFTGQGNGLFQISQGGGPATPLTSPDSSHGETRHVSPHFLPDGRHFLYLALASQSENTGIYLASLDGKDRTRLLSARVAPAYAPPFGSNKRGHLLFMRESTLMALPLDAASFHPVGEAFSMAEKVGLSGTPGARFSVSANGVLAYQGATGSAVSQLMWFDRDGKPQGAVGAPGDYTDLALSRDGKRLAVNRGDSQTRTRSLWLIDVASDVSSRFTFDRPTDSDPVWSRDGRLAFSSFNEGTVKTEIYEKAFGGSASETSLLKFRLAARPMDWSPDGRFLLFTASDPKTGWDLWTLPLEGDRKPMPYLQTPFNDTQGQFSPDGQWIAYTSDVSGSGRDQIYVESFPPGSGKFLLSTDGGAHPRWRGDGKELFYHASDGKLMAVEVKTAPTFSAGEPKALFEARMFGGVAHFGFRYDVTADGKRFLINTAPRAEDTASASITVVLNWTAGLKR